MKPHKAKPVTVEVLPSPARMLQATMDEATLQKLVQQKVAEILTARDEFIFEPFFRSQQVTFEIRRLQTVPELKKWSLFYERHGCLCCGKSERPACGLWDVRRVSYTRSQRTAGNRSGIDARKRRPGKQRGGTRIAQAEPSNAWQTMRDDAVNVL
jgi:hypothetical protein